jgi:hypothetical protein
MKSEDTKKKYQDIEERTFDFAVRVIKNEEIISILVSIVKNAEKNK